MFCGYPNHQCSAFISQDLRILSTNKSHHYKSTIIDYGSYLCHNKQAIQKRLILLSSKISLLQRLKYFLPKQIINMAVCMQLR